MVTVSTLGIVASTPGNIVLSTGLGPPVNIPSYYLVPNLFVVITNQNGGQTLTFRASVLEATINYGYDIGVATAEVQFTSDPSASFTFNLGNYSTVQIFGGCDPLGPNYSALRFTGLFLRTNATLWPHVYTMVCRGNLYRAIQYRQALFTGKPFSLLQSGIPFGQPLHNTFIDRQDPSQNFTIPGYFTGTVGTDSTDENIVYDLLQAVPTLGPTVVKANILGTGKVINFSQFDLIWPPYKSAWDMIQLLDQSFLGFRTYEDIAGVIRRQQIFGYPQGLGDTQFTEGIDIWEAHGLRTIEPLINGVYVEGMTDSSLNIPNGIIYSYIQQSNPFQPAGLPVIEQWRSTFIETNDIIDGGVGLPGPPRLNADRVGEWRLAEGNRQLVNIQLTTFRDDVLKIGHTIAVNTPHAAVTEPVWIQHVTIRMSSQPVLWQQTISGIGGGSPGFTGGVGTLGAGSSATVLVTVDTYVDNALIGLTIAITDPNDLGNLGVSRTIVSNGDNSITVSPGFATAPLTGDTYSIGTPPPP